MGARRISIRSSFTPGTSRLLIPPPPESGRLTQSFWTGRSFTNARASTPSRKAKWKRTGTLAMSVLVGLARALEVVLRHVHHDLLRRDDLDEVVLEQHD